jgi:hypothetical protein
MTEMKKFKLFQTTVFAALFAALLFASCEQEAFTPVNLTGEPAALNAAVNIAPKPTLGPPVLWDVFTPLPFSDVTGVTEIRALTANGPYLVAATSNGSVAYASRYDALTGKWTPSAPLTTLGTAFPSAAFYLNGYYLVTAGRNVIAGSYSPDGVTWSPTGNIGFGTKAGLYGPLEQLYVVAGQNGQAAFTPYLGKNFITIPQTVTGWPSGGGNAAYINAGAYGSERYVFGGGSGRIAFTDSILNPPATGWTAATTDPFDLEDFVNAIAYGGRDTFVAVGNTAGNMGIIAVSTDRGENWKDVSAGLAISQAGIFALTYDNGYYVAMNNEGIPAYSEDGINWYNGKDIAFGPGSRVNAVVFYPAANEFFAGGNNANPSMEIAKSGLQP